MDLIRNDRVNLRIFNLTKYKHNDVWSFNPISLSFKIGKKGFFNIHFTLLDVGFIFTIFPNLSEDELKDEKYNQYY